MKLNINFKKVLLLILLVIVVALLDNYILISDVLKSDFALHLGRMIVYGANGICIWKLMDWISDDKKPYA